MPSCRRFHARIVNFLGLGGLVASLFLTSCGSPQSVSSSAPPGSEIISFPSSIDKSMVTVISSSPSREQAGVAARALSVDLFDQQTRNDTLMALDYSGNLGIRGAIFVRSSRFEKRDISPYTANALSLLNGVKIVKFRYKNESGRPNHIGFIAQDVPAPFTNSSKDAMNVTNTVSVELAATQELEAQVHELRLQVRALRGEVDQMRRQRAVRH